jgi:thiamine-monophosphate kinase
MKFREDELIQSLLSFFKSHSRILVGPGDDAAIVSEMPTYAMVLTVDAQVEGVHFRRGFLSLPEIGHRALTAALSDLAAVGARPLGYLVNLEMPSDMEIKDAIAIYEGFNDLNGEFCISPIGGNIVKGTKISLVITVVGETPRDRRILRSGAEPGDLIAITGDLGRSLAGFKVLTEPQKFPLVSSKEREFVAEKFRRPRPRIREMEEAVGALEIHSAIDVSDGLGIDLGRIAKASDVTIRIKEVDLPIPKEVEKVAKEIGIAPWKLAVSSGEEFEVVFTFPKEEEPKLRRLSFPVQIIGFVDESYTTSVILETSEGEVDITNLGYDQLLGWG